MKRKLAMGLLCVALIIGSFIVSGNTDTKAAGDGNDTFQRATEITSKKTLTGVISDGDDKDWYAYTVEEDGPFFFKLTNLDESTGRWYLRVYNSDASEIAKYYNSSSEKTIASQLFSFKKGYTVYICITPDYNDAINKEYSLQVIKGTEEKYGYELKGKWESEDNDKKQSANVLNKTNPIYGLICLGEDKDVYKYEVAGDGTFSFKMENQTEWSSRWYMNIYDSDYNKIKTYYNNTSEFTIRSESFTREIGDIVFVEIKADYGDCIGNVYLISVEDNSKGSKDSGSKDLSTDSNAEIDTPYSILADTNVVVGKAEAGATVNVKYGKKTYKATADENGIYRVKTAKLKKGKKVTIWQTVGKTSSEKISVKVVEKY